MDLKGYGTCFRGKRVDNGRKDCGRGHALPRHREGQTGKSKRPGRPEQIEKVADTRESDEAEKRPSPAKTIGNPAAGILIDGVEKILGRAKQSNPRCACAQSFHILWQKLLPQLFPK